MDIQDIYFRTLVFAADKHKDHMMKGKDIPYIVHVCGVATEIFVASNYTPLFNLEYAIQVALLHDTLEDTDAEYAEIGKLFGAGVAEAVLALTKFSNLPQEQQMNDSLQRIKKREKEVWAVKLADRITNLQPPPKDWGNEKIIKYKDDAINILNQLAEGNDFLAERLRNRIEEYSGYLYGASQR